MCAKSLITDRKIALEKAARYCAYQERSQQEVRDKLYETGVAASLVEEVISELIQQDFINEERFAKAWAGGKFRIKGWGRAKIRKGLQLKRVSEYCIRAGLKEIDEADYLKTLKRLLEEKFKALPAGNPFVQNRKAAAYAISRGYEPELVWDLIRERNGE
ncbi:regulatory protein [Anseongella ginsenosidimutans]|uniref:Regulatory protein RecX n=1 Tax=Anseongella ginsenosidimutans TaxID=496056 RepID=A0A4R3KSG6_9SPHI|nr:RecX family transcriptional regulator [Anseongella ginsenosidimutans]QEC53158.1 RecX family transcriptional regulator [Anseongella ginsenosidimutans]TCS87783.1 regulatory protein [Anseongella ginsenosidimutans]